MDTTPAIQTIKVEPQTTTGGVGSALGIGGGGPRMLVLQNPDQEQYQLILTKIDEDPKH